MIYNLRPVPEAAIAAEEHFLGMLLNKPELIDLSHDIQPHDLSVYSVHYRLMREEYQRQGSVNAPHLAVLFQLHNIPIETVAELACEFVGVANISELQNTKSILKDHATRRKVVEAAEEAIKVANDLTRHSSDAVGQLALSQNDLADTGKISSQAEILRELQKNGANTPCHRTALPALDMLMGGGMYEGRVYGFSGRAKSGKTLLASTISYNLKDCKHLYVAMEMGAPQIAQRMFARSKGVNSLDFQSGKANFDGLTPNPNINFLDAAGITWDELQAQMASSVIKLGIKGVIIDYWQLVQGQNFRETEEKHLRNVAQGLADFAKKHQVWILLLSQTNEDGKTFAGQGLIKACDQLYYIETPKDDDSRRWMKMAASRYTPQADYGSELNPMLILNKRVGPYFEEIS